MRRTRLSSGYERVAMNMIWVWLASELKPWPIVCVLILATMNCYGALAFPPVDLNSPGPYQLNTPSSSWGIFQVQPTEKFSYCFSASPQLRRWGYSEKNRLLL